MIKVYENGNALISENRDFLNTNPDLACFFFWDAPLLEKNDRVGYALRAESRGEKLLALKVEPYDLLLFGSAQPAGELADFLVAGGYEIKSILGEEAVCDLFTKLLGERYRRPYYEALAMDFMEAREKTEPSSDRVEIPTEADLPEIVELLGCFIEDCGLLDSVDEAQTRKTLSSFRILREDGKIASMAKFVSSSDTAMKLMDVYTRPEYRGRGLARLVVNEIKNEILELGLTVTLNVDKNNPISNQLYRSLGFARVFSQGEYRPVPENTLRDA